MTGGARARRPVFVAGYGLVSTLGESLAAARERLADAGLPEPVRRQLVPGETWPQLAIDPVAPAATAADWDEAARRRILAAVAEAGASSAGQAPLFVASSSINIGAVELGGAPGSDCLVFSERVASWLDWQGPVYWVNTACTSAINALASAQRLLEQGAAESALVLGLELDNRFSAAGFAGMQLLSPDAARPLAVGRNGLVLGEAVAAIRLVAGDAANGQAKPRRWRLRGAANVVDGRDPAGASATAVAAMVRQALASAGLAAAGIDLVKLQAAGSPHNDAAEIEGLRQVFAELPALCSLKPLLGHTLGAAGAAELALLLACLDDGFWPPQRDAAPDPEIGAALAGEAPRRLRHLLAIILGFGGGHAALVLEDTAAVGA